MGELCQVQLKGPDDWVGFFGLFRDSRVYNSAHIRTYIHEEDTKRIRMPTLAGFSFLMQNVSPSLLPV
jgi:hypothetical protein